MWVLAGSVVVMVLAFGAATYSNYLSNKAADDTRKALCQVLVYARKTRIGEATTVAQTSRAEVYYAHQIGLVKGCRIP